MKTPFALLLLLFCLLGYAQAQNSSISGKIVLKETQQVAEGAVVFLKDTEFSAQTNSKGNYTLSNIPAGDYILSVFLINQKTVSQEITIQTGRYSFNFQLEPLDGRLDEIVVQASEESAFERTYLNSVDGFGIYEGKKTEVILLEDITANKATNNARQIFAKVPGLNIWESDGAGLQLDIAARGLGPSRTSNFNTRQNGYDMSADALGYPESYYTPPMQAVEKVEIVRGAASLQYGTQFGGMLNFVLKDAPKDKKIEFTTAQTLGSFNFLNTFNSIGGTLGKWKYYGYYQYKRGDGWRSNSAFDLHSAFGKVGYHFNDRLSLNLEYTFMDYQAQQAGGLTDATFAQNPRQSVRERNWFQVKWNLAALTLDYKITDKTKLNIRNFALLSSREALGNLERINVVDFGDNRDLIQDRYKNFGSEIRLIHHYNFLGKSSVALAGFRYYQGFTIKKQGEANDKKEADFYFLNPGNVEGSDFDFPSKNYAFFVENIWNITNNLSVTPGIRVEYIHTASEGYYKQRTFDFAGNLVSEQRLEEETSKTRSFPLFGMGVSYKFNSGVELYSNFSQNYRSITFSDLRINNPNFTLDPNITDEKGFNIDLGFRGQVKDILRFDASLFYLRYNDRIGFLLLADQPPLFLDYRFKTNVGDSRHIGFESFVELDLLELFTKENIVSRFSVFSNISYIQAKYINTQKEQGGIEGNKVEYVPEIMLRTGLSLKHKTLKAVWQLSYLGEQFTDASNAISASSAVNGLIPAYYVMDLSASYAYKFLTVESGVNNLVDEKYFTRRADSYPGPGIIPASGRSFYITLKGRF